jgi:GH25 family lysozyme M1 (1,4-beta-N-acetylmuramidase)
MRRFCASAIAALMTGMAYGATAGASDFSTPWLRDDRALVLDAYEYNEIDWQQLGTDKRIAGFINKGSDGLPPAYRCSGDEAERRLCSALWKRYSVARELYHTRKTVAKALGMKWGAYHLGRPGNPVEQADHFIEFTKPEPDDLVAIDIEDNDPEKWMSLEDAEVFARRIKARVGRYPILYTNGSTAKYIADNRARYPLLSRLPLWYARYKPEIGTHFPKGNWDGYALWQFSSLNNCNAKRCPYRVPGTPHNIDVNVAAMDADALRAAWPFGGLVDEKLPDQPALVATAAATGNQPAVEEITSVPAAEQLAAAKAALVEGPAFVPLPVSRAQALAGNAKVAFVPVEPGVEVATAYAPVKPTKALDAFKALLSGSSLEAGVRQTQAVPPEGHHVGLAEYLAWLMDLELGNLDSGEATADKRARLGS